MSETGVKRISETSSWKSIPIAIGANGPKYNDLIKFEELDSYNVGSLVDELPQQSSTLPSKQKKVQRLQRRNKLKALLTSSNEEANLQKSNSMKRKAKFKSLGALKNKVPKVETKLEVPVIDENPTKTVPEMDMSEWKNLFVPELVLKSLAKLGFEKPLPIQTQVLPSAIRDKRDILGAAETGSGKTLAFGIPLIHHLLADKEQMASRTTTASKAEEPATKEDTFNEDDYTDDDFDENTIMVDEDQEDNAKILPALVLAPTRELAIQVSSHLTNAAKYTGLRMVALVGGMAPQKQVRLLNKQPDIVIATPGRLWEMIETGHAYLQRMHRLRYLVIDEADRMLERGHFEDLNKLFEAINIKESYKKRQTFVFSATLTTVHFEPDRARLNSQQSRQTKDDKLGKLMKKIGVRSKPLIVDLTTKKMTAEKLSEAKIFCKDNEKDYYLYYFLKSYPGRTLIFTNSIDCIFRLTSLFDLLGCEPLHIHAKMQQRQRLKNLERFQANPNACMIASDVAARGLDIPDVSHVIHYQTPRTMENYIHRSGRSARSGKEGFSLVLVSSNEMNFYKRICRSLKKDDGLPQFIIDDSFMAAVKKRVNIAKEIDLLAHKQKKIRLHNDWFSKAAEAMDVELDEGTLKKNSKEEEEKILIKGKKQQLKTLLTKPIFPKGFSGKYLTQSGDLQLPGLPQNSKIRNLKKRKSKGKR